MAYLHQGHARYPMRLGHEWCGVVTAVGAGVDGGWLGRRVTGDTMIGCGHCRRCLTGRHHRVRGPLRDRHPARFRRRAGRAAAGARLALLRCPTPSTTPPARWSSRAATRCGRSGRGLSPRDRRSGTRHRHDRACSVARSPGPRGAEVHLLGRRRPSLRSPRPGLRRRLGPRRPAGAGLRRRHRRVQRGRICPRSRSTWSSRAAGRLHRAGRARRAWSTPAPGRSKTSPPSASWPSARHGRGHRALRRRRCRSAPVVAATVGLAEPPTCWPANGPRLRGDGPKMHIDPACFPHSLRALKAPSSLVGAPEK